MQPDKKGHNRPFNPYVRYSGLGLQLLLTIGVAGWLGHKLDQHLSLEFPVFLLLFVLMGLAGTLYKIYQALKRDD